MGEGFHLHVLTNILRFYCTYKSTTSLLQPLMDSVTVSVQTTRRLSCLRVMWLMPEGQVPALKWGVRAAGDGRTVSHLRIMQTHVAQRLCDCLEVNNIALSYRFLKYKAHMELGS